MKIYVNGTVLSNGVLVKKDVACDNGTIIDIGENLNHLKGEKIDCLNKFILPSLIDIHTHGCKGYDFNSASLEQMNSMVAFYVSRGVGSFLPTLACDSIENLCGQLNKINVLAKTYREVVGVNLECFISGKKSGAMDATNVVEPTQENFDRLYKASGKMVKLITVSPEVEGACELIAYAKKLGVAVNLGHSNASEKQTLDAIEAGATGFTHTFNAMMLPTQRQANIGGVALISDNYCEIIMDNIHINPTVANIIYRCKGVDKLIAVTDSCAGTGMKDGNYTLGGSDITVTNGVALVSGTNTLAGSTLTADECLTNVMSTFNLTIDKAIATMTINPAKLIGLDNVIGSIDIGKQANLLILG